MPSILDQVLADSPIQRNPLSEYTTSGYYVSLMMIPPHLLSEFDPYTILSELGTGNVEIIAETGSTEFNINSLRFTTFAGPDPRTRSTVTVEGRIEIVEPGGFSLFDTIQAKATRLGLRSITEHSYLLTLSFHGQKVILDRGGETSFSVFNIGADGRPGRVWAWRILIHRVSSKFDTGGGSYTMEFVGSSEVALTDRLGRLTTAIEIRGRTVGDVLDEITRMMNDPRRQTESETGVPPTIQYEVVMPDIGDFLADLPDGDKMLAMINANTDPKEWVIGTDDAKQTGTDASTDPANPAETRHVIANGTRIDAAILEVLMATREYRALLTRGSSESGLAARPDYDYAVNFKVEPEVRPRDWHEPTGIYRLDITFRVLPFAWPNIVADGRQVAAIRNAPIDVHLEKIRKMIDFGRLRKVYDYIYTGNNTEVIDIDLRFDLLWYALLPAFEGWEGVDTSINTIAHPKALEQKRPDSPPSGVIGEKSQNYAPLQARTSPQVVVPTGVEAPTVFITDPTPLASILVHSARTGIGGLLRHEDYYSLWGTSAAAPMDEIKVDTGFIPRTAYAGGAKKQDQERGIAHASMVERMFNGDTPTGDMVNITMRIRGDPYWLGEPRGSPAYYRYRPEPGDAAPFATGAVDFLLRFGVPDITGSGREPVVRLGMATGVYTVVRIEHIFEGGRFEQEINAVRNLMVRIPSVPTGGVGGER